ncbi:MFS transporter [Advenella kashmirensis W13003]|uniref:MFS transporter n=1 Tax=Advenella kashmirensis W13003 TaxID=1424334 RepID=V8QSB2_9BURK|nr:MFS transporter [Advenella kashmirensis]ETF02223.1 MFS transporter [Advenella kashmirensis W13003]
MSDKTPQPSYLSTPILLLMAIACGLCAGGNYFNQPLLHSISVGLGISETQAAMTVTVAQVSYALGLLFIVPLGDKFERRKLAVGLMTLAAIGQFISGFAVNSAMLFTGVGMAGLFSVAAQVLVPMAAILSAPSRSGRAVGMVMSGLLTGILLARSVAGLLSGIGGWSTVYLVSGVIMLAIALLLWRKLPASKNPHTAGYAYILASLFTLLREQPRLRTRALMGGLGFASVSALFSTMALLLAGPAHGLSDVAIGLVGLAGVMGALMASLGGRLADRGLGDTVTSVSVILLLVSWVLLWLGHDNLWWFIAGMLVIDMALQGIHINNQTVIFALSPQARSRLNAVYMTSYFIGGASGSTLGTVAWTYGGWAGTCVLGGILAILAGAATVTDRYVKSRMLNDKLPAAATGQ